ncbi:hypothetical protein B9Z55_000163 [Caenorhabditis nigoni]|nr:hypothetical protein B9Z55_000163 [Caenorhabditis nigoni]
MSSKQLLPELAENIFEYMEPGFRFHLSLHLPSLRSDEKRTRLNINRLVLTDNEISIDRTRYVLSIDLKYKKEEPPLRISGPVSCEVDEFGFKAYTKDIMMNGDVCMENYSAKDMETSERCVLGRETLDLIEAMKKKKPPEFESTLKLTITPDNGEPRVYTSSNITKIYEGMKMLIAAIFGNRTVIWNVGSMAMRAANLRWIVSGVKPLARNIEIGSYNYVNLDGLRSICHETSFPLMTLGFGMDQRILDHEIVVNAEHLIFYSAFEMFNIDFMNQLTKLPNLKVKMFRIPKDFFADLMDLWLKKRKPIGTSWSFEVEGLVGEEPFGYIDILKRNADVIESDRRFHLSLHLPSLRSVEKGAHLKINDLMLKENEITVNYTTYQQATYKLSIERKYKDQNPQLREFGSLDHDVDEFGFRTNTKDIMMNGDVCMENGSRNEESAATMRNTLIYRKIGWSRDQKSRPMAASEYEPSLKLTISSLNREPRIYRSSKITKIYEGMKILIGAIFGNRTVIWNVESMDLTTGNLRWFVSGVKPLVQNILLQQYKSVNLNGLRSICHPRSFPLKGLRTYINPQMLNHEVLVNAEKLIVRSYIFGYDTDSVDLLMKISNQKVQIMSRILSKETVVGLINFWLEHGRPVGANWSFEIDGSAKDGYIDFLRRNAQVIESDRG